MRVVVGEFIQKQKYEYEDGYYKLSIYGDYIEDVGKIVLNWAGGYSIEQLQKLNFDGGYIAFYFDKKTHRKIVFRSHQDTFSAFFTVVDDTVYFSDNYYFLCEKHQVLTWNLKAVSDYFENSWNNICKYDRTPFCQIHRLDTWHYIILDDKTTEIEQKSWRVLNNRKIYTEKNLEEFRQQFFEVLDYYLLRIHEKNKTAVFSISSGIDGNTLAARYSRLFPDASMEFITSRINDITDESKITSYMQSVLSNSIKYVPIDMGCSNIIQLLSRYIKKHLPPRFFNEVNEAMFLEATKDGCTECIHINGMGADALFGEFGNEYQYLFNELMEKREWEKARNVLTAITVSFMGKEHNEKMMEKTDKIFLLLKMCYGLSIGGSLFRTVKKIRGTRSQYSVLKVRLPRAESKSIQNYTDAIAYAGYSGEARALNMSGLLEDIELSVPYCGYRFQELKYACDPYIFSNKSNKSCMRYAVADLLPKEILGNLVKKGCPGVTLGKVMELDGNKQAVQSYIAEHESCIIDTKKLTGKVRKVFDERDFLALSLLIFETYLKEHYGIKIEV